MPLNVALRIGLIYLIVSVLWIVFSDQFVFGGPYSADAQQTLQTVKGLVFVGASTVIVTLLAWRELTRSRELERSDARYRELFAATPLPLWVFDRETLRFLEVNQAAVDHYGWSRKEFLAMDLTDIRPPEDVAELHAAVATTPEKGFHDAGLFRHRKRDGEVILVQVTAHRITFAGRAAELVVVEDMTRRLETEAQLRQAQRMESVGRLAGGVAHDFNNLLTVIGNLATLSLDEVDPTSSHAETLRQIQAAQQRGAALTRQLLTFSREAPAHAGNTDATRLLERMAAMLRPLLGEDIFVSLELPQETVAVPLPPVHLEQVIMNLAVNARDAMPQGGQLTITLAGPTEDGPPVARLTVTDTGTGMPPEVQRRIFEPFFTTKPAGKGTGLGLATSYGLVTGVGGTIVVDSQEGAGTTFRVTLPLAEHYEADSEGDDGEGHDAAQGGRPLAPPTPAVGAGAPAVRPDSPAPPAPSPLPTEGEASSGPATILVVEDEPALRTVMEKGLRRQGYAVLTAGNGREALEFLRRNDDGVDLVITDMVMPGMSGAEFLDLLAEARPGTPALRVSGYSGSDTVVEGDARSDPNFLSKPFTLSELGRAVEAMLAR